MTLTAEAPDGFDVEGFIQIDQPVSQTDWERGSGPPPELDGVIAFAGVRLSQPGCWQIRVESTRDELGSARIAVAARG